MSKTTSAATDASDKKRKVDVPTALIATILAFGVGVYGASENPSAATTPAPSESAPASSGK